MSTYRQRLENQCFKGVDGLVYHKFGSEKFVRGCSCNASEWGDCPHPDKYGCENCGYEWCEFRTGRSAAIEALVAAQDE